LLGLVAMRARTKWKRLTAASVIAGATVPAVLRWVRRNGAARRTIDMRMTVVVGKPIHDVFMFCRDFENFPEIVDVLLSVEDSQDGRSHWAVRSPSGEAIEWDATVTKYVPNSVIAWESVPDAVVQARGMMRFFPLSPEETRVDISLTYRPMHTGLSDAVRALATLPNARRLRTEISRAATALTEKAPPPPEPELSEKAPA
jgi:uncharacterized membrane protein